MIGSIISLLGAGLSLWNVKEKTKYQDKFLELKRRIYEVENMPDESRSDAELDNLYFELKILADSFASQVKGNV